jgi:hypothetical protein
MSTVANMRQRRKQQQQRRQSRISARRNTSVTPRNVVALGALFPDKVLQWMPYGEMIQRSPAAVTDYYTFRLNSTFDPDLTGVGHQPLGRDQMVVFYNRYRVHSVRVTVDFSALVSTAFCPVLEYIYFSNNGTNLANITDALEQPFCVTKFVGDPSFGYSSRISQKIDLWKLWGKPKAQYLADDTTGATNGTNPIEVMTCDIGLGTSDRITNITSWRFAIRIDYLVEWYDRIQLAAS